MEEINEISSTSISNISTENDTVDSFIDELLNKNTEALKKNDLNSISSSISKQLDKIIESHETDEATKCTKYLTASKRIKKKHEGSMKYHMEEIKMQKEIRELERKLNSCLLRNQMISQEVLALQQKKAATEEALSLAKWYYSSVWDMDIEIKESKEDRFTCIINFKFDRGMYPIEFVIDRNNREMIDWNGSSLLTEQEEDEMKKRYSENPDIYFPQVLSELRMLALNKIKMS